MTVEEQFVVSTGRDAVYEQLNDVGQIGWCVAGVKSIEVVDDDRSVWKIEQRFGIIARSFTLAAQITGRTPRERIAFSAADREVSITGRVDLADRGEGTACAVWLDIDVRGPLAPLVEIFAKGPQKALIQQTVANLRERLEGVPEPATPAA